MELGRGLVVGKQGCDVEVDTGAKEVRVEVLQSGASGLVTTWAALPHGFGFTVEQNGWVVGRRRLDKAEGHGVAVAVERVRDGRGRGSARSARWSSVEEQGPDDGPTSSAAAQGRDVAGKQRCPRKEDIGWRRNKSGSGHCRERQNDGGWGFIGAAPRVARHGRRRFSTSELRTRSAHPTGGGTDAEAGLGQVTAVAAL